MTRVILFCVKLAAVVALAVWLAERPGAVSIRWLGYQIDTSVGLLLVTILMVTVVMVFAYWLWRSIYRAPGGIRQTIRAGRQRRGYKALTQGMVAVAAGEADEASRWAKRAHSLLEEPPLTMLLSAQVAQLNGDEAAAKRYFTTMLEDDETQFLGLRGLLTQSLRVGDHDGALELARRAHAIRPGTPWVLTSLFDLSQRLGDSDGAERALKDAARAKALPAPEAARKRAVLLLDRALGARRDGDRDAALGWARQAHKLAPDLTPAAILLGEMLIATGQNRRAVKILARAWITHPHPDLARAFSAAGPDEGGIEGLKWLDRLTDGFPDHPESHLALARAALAAGLWGETRRHLSAAAGAGGLDGRPGESVCRLMAELEETENGDTEAARAWLARAGAAPQDPAWVCRECGAVSDSWSARCGACETFDGLAWRQPPRVGPALIETGADAGPEIAPAEEAGPGENLLNPPEARQAALRGAGTLD